MTQTAEEMRIQVNINPSTVLKDEICMFVRKNFPSRERSNAIAIFSQHIPDIVRMAESMPMFRVLKHFYAGPLLAYLLGAFSEG